MFSTRTRRVAAATGLALAAASLAAQVGTAAPAPVYEDQAAWNCFTMGNQVCAEGMLHVPGEHGTTGVVLPIASDSGTATVAWSNGPVWLDAPRAMREQAWLLCIEEADGSDGGMFACDDAWQYAGERFDARTL